MKIKNRGLDRLNMSLCPVVDADASESPCRRSLCRVCILDKFGAALTPLFVHLLQPCLDSFIYEIKVVTLYVHVKANRSQPKKSVVTF